MTSHCKTEAIFDYSWRQVVQAYWNRYPNPSSSHVLTEDTISREVRDGKLFSRRLLSKTNSVPKWGERFYRNTPVKIIEDSILDPKAKTLITFTRNIGMKKIMRVDEIVEYREREDGRTVAVRRAYISSQVFGFSRAIRAFGIERFKSNGTKTLNGFNFVLRRMFPNSMINTSGGALALQPPSSEVAKFSDQHNVGPTNLSKSEVAKKAAERSYIFLKAQATKVAQMFSIKN